MINPIGTSVGDASSFSTATSRIASLPLIKVPEMFIFRPIEAKLNDSQAYEADAGFYCKFKIGWHGGKKSIVSYHGKNPRWDDAIVAEETQ